MLYKSLLLPLFDYCDVCLNGMSRGNCDKLQRMQNTACRIILQAERFTPRLDMHQALGLEFLSDRRSQHVSVQAYKCVHDLAPSNLNDLFENTRQSHGAITRSQANNALRVPYSYRRAGERRFVVRGSINWNGLSQDVKDSPSLEAFKSQIRTTGPIHRINDQLNDRIH